MDQSVPAEVTLAGGKKFVLKRIPYVLRKFHDELSIVEGEVLIYEPQTGVSVLVTTGNYNWDLFLTTSVESSDYRGREYELKIYAILYADPAKGWGASLIFHLTKTYKYRGFGRIWLFENGKISSLGNVNEDSPYFRNIGDLKENQTVIIFFPIEIGGKVNYEILLVGLKDWREETVRVSIGNWYREAIKRG